MIAYFDASALVPLVIEEPASDTAGQLWDSAEQVVSARLVYAEARAAVAQAQRMGRLSVQGLAEAVRDLGGMYATLRKVGIDDSLVRRAGALAQRRALRGYDALHLAAAERVASSQTVVVAGDAALLEAAHVSGLHIARLGEG